MTVPFNYTWYPIYIGYLSYPEVESVPLFTRKLNPIVFQYEICSRRNRSIPDCSRVILDEAVIEFCDAEIGVC